MSLGKEADLYGILKGKKILYIATKNSDYIRVSQEVKILKEYCLKCDVIAYTDKSYFKRVLKVYKTILLKSIKEFDYICIGFMPQLVLPIWRWKFKENKIIIDFFISIFDTLTDDRKKIKPNSILGAICKYVDKITLKYADYIIVDTKAHGRFFSDELGADQNKIKVLYLEADENIFYPHQVTKPEKYKNKYLVCYFGSILPVQGVEVILESIKILKDTKDIHFIMIGPINEKYHKVISDTVTYVEWLSQSELANVIAYSDLCLGGHFSGTVMKARRTIPGKVYIYKALKKTVILGDSSANRELFCEIPGENYFVEMGNAKLLSKQILECFEIWDKNREEENNEYTIN